MFKHHRPARRGAPLALVLACAPVKPVAPVETTVAPVDPVVTADPVTPTRVVQASHPASCPEPHAGAPLRAAPDLRTTRVATWDGPATLRPPGEHTDLPGTVTGMLWTVAYAEGAADCQNPAPGTHAGYQFSRARGPSYALYFQSRGEGDNFLRDWQVPLPDGGVARHDAAQFGPRTGAHCLRACAHLATLAVNGGRGGRGLHFVATAVTVVDALAPLAIPDVLADLRTRFAVAWEAEERAMRRLYDDARDPYPKISVKPRVDGPIHVEPNWIADTATLEVLIWRDGQQLGERRTGTETIPPADCVYPQPCAHRESGTFDLYDALQIRGEMAARYRVDRDGVLVEETVYAPRVQATASSQRRRR